MNEFLDNILNDVWDKITFDIANMDDYTVTKSASCVEEIKIEVGDDVIIDDEIVFFNKIITFSTLFDDPEHIEITIDSDIEEEYHYFVPLLPKEKRFELLKMVKDEIKKGEEAYKLDMGID